MADNELKKLGRKDLLELLVEKEKEVQELKAKLEQAEKELAKKEIILDEAGSIAEASLKLSGIFEAAQAACAQYTDNIANLSQRQARICAQREAESLERAKSMLNETRQTCNEMLEKAKTESQEYWDNVSGKLNSFVAEHAELKQLLKLMDLK